MITAGRLIGLTVRAVPQWMQIPNMGDLANMDNTDEKLRLNAMELPSEMVQGLRLSEEHLDATDTGRQTVNDLTGAQERYQVYANVDTERRLLNPHSEAQREASKSATTFYGSGRVGARTRSNSSRGGIAYLGRRP